LDTLTQGNLSLLAVVVALLPLLSFLGILLIPGKVTRGTAVSIGTISLSFLISIFLFSKVWNQDTIHQQISWFTIGQAELRIGILLNNLSVLMMVLVSGVAVLVHVYSTRYMYGDSYLYRYWAYLSLFCFSMLGLVIVDNLFLLYMFWELVGFSSYLLIGFWFTKHSAIQANKKAFILNRLGDLGFFSGLMIVYAQFGTFDITLLFQQGGLVINSITEHGLWINGEDTMPAIWLTFAGLAFFLAATAKSAQFPLHIWLPDAMEGPTSVSSLIHAATMVAAGVFLLGRIYPIFDSTALLVIASIGAFTAFMAATIAMVQTDIKRILAFSTISQLGFMMIAMGVGAYASGIFHLSTHAFFKCLLFLAAGAVIHEMAHVKEKYGLSFDHQNIHNMGGLRKKMPVTFITMMMASLALIGFPFTSGFLSKDAILIQSFEWSDVQNIWARLIPYSALVTSWLTVFYIARLIFKVFFGKFRLERLLNIKPEIHEAPNAMKYVLVVLALFCLFPVFSLNPFHYDAAWIIKGFPVVGSMPKVENYHTIIPLAVNVGAVALMFIAYNWFAKRQNAPDFSRKSIFTFVEKQWFFNDIYHRLIIPGTISFSTYIYGFDSIVIDGFVNLFGKITVFLSKVADWADRYIIDGLVNSLASISKTIGNFTRHFQTGRLQHYLLSMVLVVLAAFIIKLFFQAI